MVNKSQFLVSLLILILGISFHVNAQYKTRLWNSYSVGAPLTENLNVSGSFIKSIDLSSSKIRTSFNWYALKFGYKINRDWNVELGTAWLNLPNSDRTTHRIFAEGTHRIKLDQRFVLKNSIQFEKHNRQESRFDYRFIFSSRLGLRKRLDFLKVAPSLTYRLFYNIGGAPIRYFNEEGEEIASDAANGFHRGRIIANFNFKLSAPIRLSVYYMNQHEFNLVLAQTNKINVLNPNTGRIQRSFNNQHIIGIALSYRLGGIIGDALLPFDF